MPRGCHLTEAEQAKILAYNDSGLSNRQISVRIGRSHTVINRFLANPNTYGPQHRSGRPRKLSIRDDRAIQRHASNKVISLSKIRASLGLNVCSKTIGNSLRRGGNVVFRKLKKAPMLTQRHKSARVAFTRVHINQQTDFTGVIWSDEKKWNLDGPDGNRDYWRDLRKEPLVFSKRGFGGGSVMMWAAFCADGTVGMEFVTSRMNSSDYQDVLQKHLVPFMAASPRQLVFQHGNAPIHASRSTSQWLSSKNVTVMQWPSCSPDLNPIENLWGLLVRKVYEGGKQFANVNDLKRAIEHAWNNLQPSLLRKLSGSLPNRLSECLLQRGGYTDY